MAFRPEDYDHLDLPDPNFLAKELDPSLQIASLADVRQDAQARSKDIFASYQTLHDILDRHEKTIQKRWTKKTRQQRQKILASAKSLRECYMWPHISQNDLLKPKTLLLLLNARGRHLPPTFAGADKAAMQLGLVTKKLRQVFLCGYMMVLHGVQSPREYGELFSWEEHPDAFQWTLNRKQSVPGEATTFPIRPEPDLTTERGSNGIDSLAMMAAEAPYRLPAKLDFSRIERVLGARASAAEDHVWALREDPAYFAEQLIEVREHRPELLKDTSGHEHPVMKTTQQDTLWARVCRTVSLEAHLHLESYTELYQQAQTLRTLQTKHAAAISPTGDLPDELMDCLFRFRRYLNQAAKHTVERLRHNFAASPPWRQNFVRQPPADSTTITIRGLDAKTSDIEQQVLWFLSTVWEDSSNLLVARLPLIVDQLGWLLETETRAKELLSARIAGIVGDLAIITHCIAQLELYTPWARGFELAHVERQGGIEAEFAQRTVKRGMIVDALRGENLTQVARLGNPSDMRFAYPFEKWRTRQNVEILPRAERNLDEYWAAIDRILYSNCGNLEGTAIRRVLTRPRAMQRTPDFAPPLATDKPSREPVLDPGVAGLYRPLSTIYIAEPAGAASSSPLAPTPKMKEKTRDTTSSAAAPPEPIAADATPQTEPPSIPVDARSLRVFRALFFNPAVTSSPGEISWTDFLRATISTGLFTAEKLYGSVWQFQKREGDQSRIQFHEPHLRAKIPFTTARRHGRRLNRAFGWVGDTFLLKLK
ncbi:Uu.00g070370.m01.CDS01 [Anthostomella pinea]|uniref:Uu.00g070370.m01.CDS01 n=1 Tax=Anthostomella pinea TaxID=933095 RepID=A0AAI8VUN2_9PEZI|nr:Uu.00g070370.m01.CDS01 [Anthostomella pinea]